MSDCGGDDGKPHIVHMPLPHFPASFAAISGRRGLFTDSLMPRQVRAHAPLPSLSLLVVTGDSVLLMPCKEDERVTVHCQLDGI